MGVRVFISGISGNKEVKKRQQRVLMILDSRNIEYDVIDIAEPAKEDLKDFMQSNATSLGGTACDPKPRHPLPPQIFNGDDYCGDYDQFDLANEVDELEKFLKLVPDSTSTKTEDLQNGEIINEIQTNGKSDIDNSAGDAVVGSTTEESNEAPVENGTHETNNGDVGVSDETVDSSNANDIDDGGDDGDD